jgi:hypothetical protein
MICIIHHPSTTLDIGLTVINSLFFRDYHIDLLHVLSSQLSRDGTIIMIAPRRGATLATFQTLASSLFDITLHEHFDDIITKHHEEATTHDASYHHDIHQPLLLLLKHRSTSDYSSPSMTIPSSTLPSESVAPS